MRNRIFSCIAIVPCKMIAPRNLPYKTELCNKFSETGSCRYGMICRFAHGRHELKKDVRVVKGVTWKTYLCRNYHGHTTCPYGKRCHFIHDETEQQLFEMRCEPCTEDTSIYPGRINNSFTLSNNAPVFTPGFSSTPSTPEMYPHSNQPPIKSAPLATCLK